MASKEKARGFPRAFFVCYHVDVHAMTPYRLKRSARARALRIDVHPGGDVVITAPDFLGASAIESFVARHKQWIARKVRESRSRSLIRVKRRDIAALKEKARAFAESRAAHFATIYGVSFKRITIRAQKTRWGSCSRLGSLSFNYKIAALPERLADYVIAHEICHLRHFDHSHAFWGLVAETFPDYRDIRRAMRRIAFAFS